MEVYKIFQSQDFKTLDSSKESEPNVYQYDRCKKWVYLLCQSSQIFKYFSVMPHQMGVLYLQYNKTVILLGLSLVLSD